MVGKHSKYVQELLGHASIFISLDTYSQVIEVMGGGLGVTMDDTFETLLLPHCCHRGFRLRLGAENPA
jgi:hypothetical protein